MDIQDMKEQRQAFDEWHYNQYLIENPNIDITNAKYIYDYAHKNVLVFQLRESHFTAWQAAKAQAVQQWISVKDEMPEQGQKVLVFRPHAHEKPYKDPNYKICTYAGEDIFINSHFEHEITHWMLLPEPPTKECE